MTFSILNSWARATCICAGLITKRITQRTQILTSNKYFVTHRASSLNRNSLIKLVKGASGPFVSCCSKILSVASLMWSLEFSGCIGFKCVAGFGGSVNDGIDEIGVVRVVSDFFN